MKVIIDRFEGDFAVVELPDGEIVDLPCALFADAKEGDIISITVDADETAKRRERIAQLQESIWAD